MMTVSLHSRKTGECVDVIYGVYDIQVVCDHYVLLGDLDFSGAARLYPLSDYDLLISAFPSEPPEITRSESEADPINNIGG